MALFFIGPLCLRIPSRVSKLTIHQNNFSAKESLMLENYDQNLQIYHFFSKPPHQHVQRRCPKSEIMKLTLQMPTLKLEIDLAS